MTSLPTIPDGTYLVRIDEVRTSESNAGHPRHAIKLIIADGIFRGRFAAWDAMVLSPRGLPRARGIVKALGLDIETTCGRDLDDLQSSDLTGRMAWVEIRTVSYMQEGTFITRTEVPFEGWSAEPSS